jgi:nucleoside-diphosphate-sugar epimerase
MADERHKVVLAGATGKLGGRIARALTERGASVTALVRAGTAASRIQELRTLGVEVAAIDLADRSEIADGCAGAVCVVSALSGLRDTIVDGQTAFLEGAVRAGVPRFIPSDFSIDYGNLSPESNRNFALRREFAERLDRTSIAATSIFNGAFADMLTGQAPLVIEPLKRVLYVENPDQPLDFTTMDDTAAYTAAVALDSGTPRKLHIAGDRLSARQLAAVVSALRGREYKLFPAGSLAFLAGAIKVVRALYPARGQVFPPWQGMQYMHNMFSGEAGVPPLDNDRYPGLRWTKVRDVLGAAGRS